MTAQVNARGQVGPQISDEDIKQRVKGKRYGDIQADLKSIEGINDVMLDLSPFWVNSIPKDDAKITIKFNLETVEN